MTFCGEGSEHQMKASLYVGGTTRVSRERLGCDAGSGKGQTIFEVLVEIIRIHGVGGREARDNVTLVLE